MSRGHFKTGSMLCAENNNKTEQWLFSKMAPWGKKENNQSSHSEQDDIPVRSCNDSKQGAQKRGNKNTSRRVLKTALWISTRALLRETWWFACWDCMQNSSLKVGILCVVSKPQKELVCLGGPIKPEAYFFSRKFDAHKQGNLMRCFETL